MQKITIGTLAAALAALWTVGPAIAADTKVEQKAEQAADKIERKAEQASDKIEQKADKAEDKIERKAEQAGDKSESKMDKLKAKAREAKDKMKDKTVRTKDKIETKIETADVKNAQRNLRARGFDPGPIDGVHGPQTTAAVRDFQQQEGLTVTGQLDTPTMDRLSSPSASPATAPRR